MEIRAGTDNDIPEIVRLLKISLGESLVPKSEAYWRWKHLENPFGQSPVLVAIENNSIVGVRAFMRWTWEMNGRQVSSVRAVDTATHPEFQGKGIFSSLTRGLLKQCQEEGISIVFNTPNEKSMPGYLKMGWEKAGRLPVRIGIRRPMSMMLRVLRGKTVEDSSTMERKELEELKHPGLPALLERNKLVNRFHLVTAHSVDSLKWRYQDVPVGQYYGAPFTHSGMLSALLLYRIKVTRFGIEMRITDIFHDGSVPENRISALVRATAQERKADFVTSEGLTPLNIATGIQANRAIGPVVTIRNLSGDIYPSFLKFSHWRPSVGDLELF